MIAGVGVRNYYRRLGYKLCGDGQYLVKVLQPRPTSECARTVTSLEASFYEAAERVRPLTWRGTSTWQFAAMISCGIAAASLLFFAVSRRSLSRSVAGILRESS